MVRINAALLLFLAFGVCTVSAEESTSQQIFEKRLMPIFQSPNPSSCVQCHFASVDLKNYILPSHEKTFLSLRDQGLIDIKNPEKSKILTLIQMGEKDAKGAALIHEKTRKAEYEAFAEWIKAACKDPKLTEAPRLKDSELASPPRPTEVIRHARKDRLLESFERNIWSMRFRCMTCHIEGTEANEKHRKEHGDRVSWMKKEGAEATMNYLIRDTKLIDTKEPEKSLLLLKPLNDVKHAGGKKFLPGDLGYKGMRAWIEDYSAIVNNSYKRGDDLPKKTDTLEYFGTDIWFKLSDTPPEWADKLLMVKLYAWDEEKKAFEETPIASTDRAVWGKGKTWQHTLTLSAEKGSSRAAAWRKGNPTLPQGNYLVKVYVDGRERLAKDWKVEMEEADLVGQGEVRSRWPGSYGQMTVLPANRVKK